MKKCLKILTLINIISLFFAPVLSFAVSNDTNINLEVIEEIEEEIPPSRPGVTLLDIISPVIYNLFISKITLNSVTIEWKTDELALCQLFLGKTQEYKEGTVSETTFHFSHKTELTNLLSETTYHFKIKCRDANRNESETVDQKFTTLSLPDIFPPANVSNFEAIAGDKQITLKWQNSTDSDFKAVRIMRSEDFYPQDPEQGKLVYDDRETSFVDTGLINGKRYYYTAFSYDFSGNFSSGAIVSAVPRLKPPPPPETIFTEKECLEAGYYWYDETCHRESKIVPAPPEVEKITIDDFDFIQTGRKIPIIDGKLEIKKEEPLEILIDYDKVPEVLKTITITLEKPARRSLGEGGGEKFFSFLLRINKEKTAYLATLMPPDEPGVYPLTIAVLDYKNQTLKKIHGFLEVFRIPIVSAPVPWYREYLYIYILLAILILGGIIYFYKKLKIKYQR